jgi:hypothetical protein
MADEFRYLSGESVHVGDRVASVGGRQGEVTELLISGTDTAREFLCPDGGVLIMEDWNGIRSPRVIAIPGNNDWDDILLLGREVLPDDKR